MHEISLVGFLYSSVLFLFGFNISWEFLLRVFNIKWRKPRRFTIFIKLKEIFLIHCTRFFIFQLLKQKWFNYLPNISHISSRVYFQNPFPLFCNNRENSQTKWMVKRCFNAYKSDYRMSNISNKRVSAFSIAARTVKTHFTQIRSWHKTFFSYKKLYAFWTKLLIDWQRSIIWFHNKSAFSPMSLKLLSINLVVFFHITNAIFIYRFFLA